MTHAVVINPGTHPEPLQLALGFEASGLIVSYATASSWRVPRTGARVLRALGPAVADAALGRAVPEPLAAMSQRAGGGWELLFQVARRIRPQIAPALLERRNRRFLDRIGTASLVPDADVVVAQQGSGLATFGLFPDALKVVSAPIAHPIWARRYLQAEGVDNPDWAQFVQMPIRDEAHERRIEKEVDASDLVLVASSFTARTYVESGVAPEKIVVVPLGAAPSSAAAARRSPSKGRLRVTFAGQVNQRKGLSYFLQAAKAVAGLDVVFAGPVDDAAGRRIRQFLPEATILGPLAQRRLFAVMQSSDLVVLPSLIEGFGLTALEAMAVGVPALVTTHTFGTDIITDDVDGFVVDPRDSTAIAEKLRRAEGDRDALKAIGQRAQARSRSFTWDRYRRDASAALLGHAGQAPDSTSAT